MEKLRAGDPEEVGPYKIVARLGAGGMGVVFLGTRGVERYAIKVVRHSFLDNPQLKSRFVREIETLTKVSSPFVARIVDSSIDEDIAWHAVEFVNGPTLQELIQSKGPLPEEEWWRLASELAVALREIHSLGIAHRDIKPSNIIVADSGLKLIDFGIAQDLEATSLTSTGLVSGSPAWLSPEQLAGSDNYLASDLFSAGSVLTYAALGRSPWGEETTMSVPVVYRKILDGKPNLDGLTQAQETLVLGLMHIEPENREFAPVEELLPSRTSTHTTQSLKSQTKPRDTNADDTANTPPRPKKNTLARVVSVALVAILPAFGAIVWAQTDSEESTGTEPETVSTAQEKTETAPQASGDYLDKAECAKIEDLRQALILTQKEIYRDIRERAIPDSVGAALYLASIDGYRDSLSEYVASLPHDELNEFMLDQFVLLGDWTQQISTSENDLYWSFPLDFPSSREWQTDTRSFLQDASGYCFN